MAVGSQPQRLLQLVRVDLANGAVSEVTRPSVNVEYAQPRVSPDGTRIVFVRHQDGAWKAVVRELASGSEVELPTGAGASVAYPTWGANGDTVFASVGQGGFIDVVVLAADGSRAGERITATIGAALAPAPSPDGTTLYFLGLQADGLDLRTVKLGEQPSGAGPRIVLAPELAPAVRPAPPPVVQPAAATSTGPGRHYGFGRQEFAAVFGGNLAPSSHALELGVRVGDVVGRLDTLAIGSLADSAGPQGGTLTGAWRGWPVAVSVQLFTATENPSRQAREVPDLGRRLDAQRRGVALEGTWQRRWRAGVLELGAEAYVGRMEPAGGPSVGQRVGSVSARVTETPSRALWRFPPRSMRASTPAAPVKTGGEGERRAEVGAFRRRPGWRSRGDVPACVTRPRSRPPAARWGVELRIAGRVLAGASLWPRCRQAPSSGTSTRARGRVSSSVASRSSSGGTGCGTAARGGASGFASPVWSGTSQEPPCRWYVSPGFTSRLGSPAS
jgi:hypothetical protein